MQRDANQDSLEAQSSSAAEVKMDQEVLTLDQLRERISSAADGRDVSAETLDALAAGFYDPAATRPIERGLGEAGVVYAWRSEDASIVNAALEFLEGAFAAFQGDAKGAGKELKSLVTFWVQLRRNRVRLADPKQVAVLLMLKEHPAGMTASELWKALGASAGSGVFSLDDVEVALEKLGKGEAGTGAKQLVIADAQVWKCRV
jgi:hypothetical protein